MKIFVVLLAIGCVRPTEERTRRDERVGHAAVPGLAIDVDDGLAAIRSIDAAHVRLWAGAPTIVFSVSAPVELTVDNCLPDATIAGAIATPGDHPTERIFAIPAAGRWKLAAPSPVGAFRIAVLADVQEAIDRVGDVYARMDADPAIRFVLFAGDATEGGTLEEMETFERALDALDVPMYLVPGNHDLDANDLLFGERFGRGNFHFEWGGVAFTGLDTASAMLDPIAWSWLDGWLADARGLVHVVYGHIPPLDPIGSRNQGFADREDAARLLAELAGAGVDQTLWGHIHSYYDLTEGGIPTIITGGGGSTPERWSGIGRHYVVLDLDPVRGVLDTGLVRVD